MPRWTLTLSETCLPAYLPTYQLQPSKAVLSPTIILTNGATRGGRSRHMATGYYCLSVLSACPPSIHHRRRTTNPLKPSCGLVSSLVSPCRHEVHLLASSQPYTAARKLLLLLVLMGE